MLTASSCMRRLVRLLLAGHVPQHVAFIMDGNRRFADAHTMQKIDGHTAGYGKMVEVIQWCLELGVAEVSAFAFSIDNFSRPQQEVADLMQLVEAKCGELLRDNSAQQWNAQLRVLGDLTLAPQGLQAAAAQLMLSSPGPGATATVNIFFCYTGSHELDLALGTLQQALASCSLLPQDLCPQLLGACCTTQGSRPVDLLVRTSGEQRLSDFLPFQARHALLHWSDTLWPDFGFVQLLEAVREWQGAAAMLQQLAAAAAGGTAAQEADYTAAELHKGRATAAGKVQLQVNGKDGGQCSSGDSLAKGVAEDSSSDSMWWRLCGLFNSSSLSAIHEEGPCHCPHPSQQLRKEGFLQWLQARNRAWLEAAAAG